MTLLNKLEKMNVVPFSLYTCSNTQKSERSLMYLFICFLKEVRTFEDIAYWKLHVLNLSIK